MDRSTSQLRKNMASIGLLLALSFLACSAAMPNTKFAIVDANGMGNAMIAQSQQEQLEQIRNAIQQRGVISAATVGYKLALQVDLAFHSGNLTVGYINATLDNTHLVVLGKARLWDASVVASFTFFFPTPTSTEVQLQIQFKANFDPVTIYQAVFPNATAPSFLRGVRASEQLTIVLSTIYYNSYPTGLTVSSASVITSSQNEVAQALATLNPNAASSNFNANLYVPLFSTNPTYISLQLTEQGNFALTKSIQCSAYQLSVSVSAATTFALSSDLIISVTNQPTPVTFSASALWKANTTTSFSGSLSGSWIHPFGADWITSITNAKINFAIGSQTITEQITIDGTAVFSFAPQSQSTFHVVLLGSGDFVFSVNSLISSNGNSISNIYSAIAKTSTPEIFTGAILSGNVGFALSSYNSGSTQKGLLLFAKNVKVSFGTTLDKAVKTLATSPQTFTLSLFIPVYGGGQTVQFSLLAGGSFAFTQSITISSYSVSVSVSNSRPSVTLSATASVALANQPQPLSFSISTSWQEGAAVNFQGSLQGTWQHPFSFGWLSTVSSVSLSISFSGSGGSVGSAKVSISGTGSLASAPGRPFSFTINVIDSGDWQFTVSNLPIQSLSSFYSSVVEDASSAILNDVQLSGQVSLAIATYSAGSVTKGLTVSSTVTVTSGSSLAKAVRTLRATTSQERYQLAFFVPILGAQGSATFSLSETGSFSLTSHIQVSSYSVNVVLPPNPSITLTAQLAVSIANQPQPLVVNVNGRWNEQSSSTTFTGTLASWTHPLGLSWLTLQNLNINLVVSSSAEPQLSLSGTAALSFSTSPVSTTIQFNNGDIVLSVANIPINTLIFLYKATVGVNPPQYLVEISAVQGTVSFTLATASLGSARKGLAVSAQATLLDGTLANVAKTLIASPSSVTYNLNLFIPIFDSDPSAISLSLTESGSFDLTHSLRFQSFQLALNVAPSQSTTIALSAQLAVTLSQQPQPVVFDISGAWQDNGLVRFSGKLNGQWPNPFGVTWLSISGASLQLTVQQAFVQSLSIAGASRITFDSTSVDASFSITTSNDFVDSTFVAQGQAKWSLSQIARSITGKTAAVLNDVNQNDVALTIILSTYANGNFKTGLTIQTSGDITGNLLQRVRALNPNKVGSIQWKVGMNIPLFTSDPLDVALTLEIDSEVQLTKSFYYEKLALEVDAFPLAVSADTEFKATFTKNPALYFNIDGSFSADGSVTLTGDMIGVWENVFGIQGFNLSDIVLELGFNPAMCAVDGCIADLGLGFNMMMGTKTIIFDGNAAAPDFEDVFLKGSVSGANGLALTVLDIVIEWNRNFPSLRIPTASIPANWGLKDTSFYFAPKDGTFGSITYQEGFSFTGGIEILDMDLDFTVGCSPKLPEYCDFSIDVHLDFHLFWQMLKREVDILNAVRTASGQELIVFTLDDLSLTQWSAANMAHGVNPRWQIGLTVFDKKHHLDFEVEQWMMARTFREFFDRWIKHIF